MKSSLTIVMASITVNRPWGSFTQFTHNEPSTVKIITVNSGQELSLQYHTKRSEFWRVIAGNPIITIDNAVTEANVGDEFTVPVQAKHRIAAQDEDVVILEISMGTFDEDDIVRLADKYGRVT
jgi:mannose-6-phosphate isomerase-like protein (cupin superfamily)